MLEILSALPASKEPLSGQEKTQEEIRISLVLNSGTSKFLYFSLIIVDKEADHMKVGVDV